MTLICGSDYQHFPHLSWSYSHPDEDEKEAHTNQLVHCPVVLDNVHNMKVGLEGKSAKNVN